SARATMARFSSTAMRRGPSWSDATRSATVAPSGNVRGSSFTVTCTSPRRYRPRPRLTTRARGRALPGHGWLRRIRAVKTRPSASPPHDGEKDRAMEDYEQDFYAWTQRTAELLRAGRFDEADIEHVAEEIEDMGRRDVRELSSRMQVLL